STRLATSPRGNSSRRPCGPSRIASGPVMPRSASSAACTPACATRAWERDLVAEMLPRRTMAGVAARDAAIARAWARRVSAVHQVLNARVQLVAGDDRLDDLFAGAPALCADGKRNRDVVARMSRRFRLPVGLPHNVIVEIEHANGNTVNEHRVENARPLRSADQSTWSARA